VLDANTCELAGNAKGNTMEIDSMTAATSTLAGEHFFLLLLLKKREAIRTFTTVFSVFVNSENLQE